MVKDAAGLPTLSVALARELVERDNALFAPLAGIEVDGGNDSSFFLRPSYRTEALSLVEWFGASAARRAPIVRGTGESARACVLQTSH